MQIKGMINFIYYKTIEKLILDGLEECSNIQVNRDYTVPINYQMTSFKKYDSYIDRFKEIFKNSFTEEQYKRMMSNLRSLTIKERNDRKDLRLYFSLGYYDSFNNTITIVNYDNADFELSMEEVLFHELLHMASTNYTNKGDLTGLELPDLLGLQLNEGYTEYLTRKYFTRGYKYTESNDNSVFIAKGIENIIGKEKMEEYYFNSDINSLIKELSKYTQKDDVIKLLFLIDRIPDSTCKSKEFDDVVKEIARLNKIKLDRDLEDGVISRREYDEEYAIKVREYRMYQMWSEDTIVIEDGSSFVLSDHEYTSRPYPREQDKENPKKYM